MQFKHERFDRHSLFTSDDRSLVLNIIGKVSKPEHPNIVNMLFGLFDGYWYVSLEDELMKTNIDTYKLSMLSGLLNKVAASIAVNV